MTVCGKLVETARQERVEVLPASAEPTRIILCLSKVTVM